jgi:4-carboxymuconolactone decarboxylase
LLTATLRRSLIHTPGYPDSNPQEHPVDIYHHQLIAIFFKSKICRHFTQRSKLISSKGDCYMARIPYINKDNATREVADIFTKMEANGADVLNLWKMAAHSPATLIHMVRLGNSILSRTQLDPKLRELAILRVAEILDCEYERQAHTVFGKDIGLTDRQIIAVKDWGKSSVFSMAEQAVLRYTDEITRNGKVSRATFSETEKHISYMEMMDLTVAAGFYGMLARLLLTFEVDLEDNKLSSAKIVGRRSS